MKKFLAILMAAMMLLSMATVAMAEGGTTPTYDDMSTVTVKKRYKLTNSGTTSPAETFTLTQADKKVTEGEATSAPDLGTITGAAYKAGDATSEGVVKEITINLPSYDRVGIYTYILREENNGTAGVDYHTADIKLVVTVIEQEGKIRVAAVHTEEDGKKNDTFENTYSAGSLTVSKTVEGLLGDKSKAFHFAVTFTSNKKVASTVMAGNEELTFNKTDEDNTSTWNVTKEFDLSSGQSLSFTNLPYGVSYTVSEMADANYNTKINGVLSTADNGKHTTTGSIDSATATVAYTNTRDGKVDTGVSLDTLPYVLVLALAGAGLVLMIARKRRVQD